MNITAIKLKKFVLPVFLMIAAVLLAFMPSLAPRYTIILLTSIFMYVILTVSWTIFSGSTGYISLATAAFFGVGTYTAAFLGHNLPLPLVVLCGGLISLLLAVLVGALTLRLRGVYFTIFTFGLIELIRHTLTWWEINKFGTRGRFVVRVDNNTVFYIMLTIMVVMLLCAFFMRRSRFGLALFSIGECEDAACHMGINVTVVKLAAFALSAFFIGLSGAIIATRWTYVDPLIAFNPLFSFLPVLMAIFGGMGSLFGPVLGAAAFAYIQELLITRLPHHYMLLFGIIMVVSILFLPTGLLGLAHKCWTKASGGKYANTASGKTV